MSAKSELVRKAQFLVMYRMVELCGEPVAREWREFSSLKRPYMAACEQAERLRGEYQGRCRYEFKVAHEKLVRKEN